MAEIQEPLVENAQLVPHGLSSRCRCRFGSILGALCVLAIGLGVFRAPLLTGLANSWIVDDAPEKSDAIVVLGGGVDYRPFAAARLYNDGWAPTVLIMDVGLSPTEEMGLKQPERDVTRQVLLKQGVPEQAIVPVGRSVKNTFEESKAVLAWATEHGAQKLLIATELFHTRRARWVFRKQFRGTHTLVKFAAVAPGDYARTNWWQHEQGLINFQNEWVKLPYYWLKY
jgi:uncharacterized SAM-binding protein YcdF (DUF218 family)